MRWLLKSAFGSWRLSWLMAVTLAACAPQTVWVKDGADAEVFRRDREECVGRAENYGFIDDRRSRNQLGSTGADIYRSCLESRGWHRERAAR